MGNPLIGMVFGLAAIGFAVFSIATRTETPSPGYALLDYALIGLGAVGFIGSMVAFSRKK